MARPELEVLFVTGYAHNAAVGNGMLEPGMDIITKLFTVDGLAGRGRTITTTGRVAALVPATATCRRTLSSLALRHSVQEGS